MKLKSAGISVFFAFAFLIQSCGNAAPISPTPKDEATPTYAASTAVQPTPVPPTQTPVPTGTALPAATAVPQVTISAVGGNVFIRRGPGMAYNPIGVLYQGTSQVILARDVLSRWVEVSLPNSEKTGWIYLNSGFSKVEGELASVPDFTTTDWPVPGYLINCTHHDMYIMPGEVILPASFDYPPNDVWLYPGFYTVQDIMVPGEPKVLDIEMREGIDIEIRVDGSGEKRKCP